jgi:hypothetical protein
MFAKTAGLNLVALTLFLCAAANAQDDKKRSGKVIGTVQAQKDSKDGKNTTIDVLAPGEEKARGYHVLYDPKAKAPIASVLKAVRAAHKGDLVELEWVDTSHGLAIKSFHVLKKAVETKKENNDKK